MHTGVKFPQQWMGYLINPDHAFDKPLAEIRTFSPPLLIASATQTFEGAALITYRITPVQVDHDGDAVRLPNLGAKRIWTGHMSEMFLTVSVINTSHVNSLKVFPPRSDIIIGKPLIAGYDGNHNVTTGLELAPGEPEVIPPDYMRTFTYCQF